MTDGSVEDVDDDEDEDEVEDDEEVDVDVDAAEDSTAVLKSKRTR